MITVKTDLHTHSIFSLHAYSTIEENSRNGAQLGMEAVGISDHFSGMFYRDTDFSNYGHMINYKALPKEWYGVRILHGAEADIVDLEGHLFGSNIEMPRFFPGQPLMTLEQMCLSRLDYVIASIHNKSFTLNADIVQTTAMYCKALQHPKVLAIGHIGRAGVPFDMDEVLKTAKALNKMIEINEASMDYPEEITGKCRDVAVRCAQLGVKIAVNSDAHSAWYVGRYDKSIKMLEEIHFPQELIGNRDLDTLEGTLRISGVRDARI